MKKGKKNTAFVLVVLCVIAIASSVSFTGCQMENPIMERWWEEHAREFSPDEAFQILDVVTIHYVIFAGEQLEFNNPIPGMGGSSMLTPPQVQFNASIIDIAAEMLLDRPQYRVILHGNANPVLHTAEERIQLAQISLTRANNTAAALADAFTTKGGDITNLMGRMRTVGYGGGLTISDPLHADLNRRVEVIIFTVETQSN